MLQSAEYRNVLVSPDFLLSSVVLQIRKRWEASSCSCECNGAVLSYEFTATISREFKRMRTLSSGEARRTAYKEHRWSQAIARLSS